VTAEGELVSRDHWTVQGGELAKDPDNEELRSSIVADLQALHQFVRFHACTFDFGWIRECLVLPFESSWNRLVNLWVDWIMASNSFHFGNKPDWSRLAQDWELSGLQPPGQ